LTYAPAARIWRINRGWRRRKDKKQLGFYINPVSGVWSKQDSPDEEQTTEAPEENLLDKVPNQPIVPFVEDHRNILILTPTGDLSKTTMATLQSALRRGIEQTFQIEEAELIAEPLPDQDQRRALLFYEAAEGGAGVLSRLATERQSLAEVAATALRLMHFESPADGVWSYARLSESEEKREIDGQKVRICEAGCYQCLLSYFNQPDHDVINRLDEHALRMLTALANASVVEITTVSRVADADTALRRWLAEVETRNLRRPDAVTVPVNGGMGTADAHYKAARTLVFLALPADEIMRHVQDRGYSIILFGDEPTWSETFGRYPEVFNAPAGGGR
jgi:C4-dicarboxylate-specific signal transduction histidine kinase